MPYMHAPCQFDILLLQNEKEQIIGLVREGGLGQMIKKQWHLQAEL